MEGVDDKVDEGFAKVEKVDGKEEEGFLRMRKQREHTISIEASV